MIYLPIAFLIAFLSKIIISGTNLSDSLVLIALCGLYGYFYFLETKRQVPVNKSILDTLEKLETQNKAITERVNALSLVSGLSRHK